MRIAKDCVVKLHYELKNDAGEELSSSSGGEPLAYLHGHQGIIPGLENALDGKAEGEALEVTVQPAEGYGEANPALVQQVPRSAFQGVDDIAPGMQFKAQTEAGQEQLITVREVGDESVTIDANHPLAGQVLHFSVAVESVREATQEEIAHGHVH